MQKYPIGTKLYSNAKKLLANKSLCTITSYDKQNNRYTLRFEDGTSISNIMEIIVGGYILQLIKKNKLPTWF